MEESLKSTAPSMRAACLEATAALEVLAATIVRLMMVTMITAIMIQCIVLKQVV